MGLSVIAMLFSRRSSAVLQAVCSDAPWAAVLCLGFALSAEGDIWCRSSGWEPETRGSELTTLGTTRGPEAWGWPAEGH